MIRDFLPYLSKYPFLCLIVPPYHMPGLHHALMYLFFFNSHGPHHGHDSLPVGKRRAPCQAAACRDGSRHGNDPSRNFPFLAHFLHRHGICRSVKSHNKLKFFLRRLPLLLVWQFADGANCRLNLFLRVIVGKAEPYRTLLHRTQRLMHEGGAVSS